MVSTDDNSPLQPDPSQPDSSQGDSPAAQRRSEPTDAPAIPPSADSELVLQPIQNPVLFAEDPLTTGDPFAHAERLGGDPLASIALGAPQRFEKRPIFPEDLRISWSWAHFFMFVFFGIASIFTVQIGMAFYIASGHHWTAQQMAKKLEADPSFLVATNVLWFASLILFLYVTIAVLRGDPFWQSLGWHKLKKEGHSYDSPGKGRPWMYFVAGCGLSLFVAIAGSRVKETGPIPMQELFKNRNSALLLMAMAVLIAPLVEETVFRGYIYPLFATKLSTFAARFGVNPERALRYGTFFGILLTGLLFGLAHGAQLGWTWGLVSLLIFVGIIFTFVRAWTGTVLASFLLHLGYNSTIAITTIIATHGFTRMPPHP